MKRQLKKEEEEKIIYNYTILKLGQKESGREFNVSDYTVKKILRKYGTHIRSAQEIRTEKQYRVNHNYFNHQSHDMAYWLGILGSDGTVSKNKNMVAIELQRKDKELLVKLNTSINNEREVKDYFNNSKQTENSKLYFYSYDIKQQLKIYNIIPNKTYDSNYDFPTKLKSDYYIDYIRGLFDGDGAVYKNGSSMRFQIDSSCKNIILKLQQIFLLYDIELNWCVEPRQNINICRLYCYGNDKIQKIYNLLYSTPSNLFLKRKKDKFEELLNS